MSRFLKCILYAVVACGTQSLTYGSSYTDFPCSENLDCCETYNPTSTPGCCNNFLFTVDYLYWEARSDELYYALHGTTFAGNPRRLVYEEVDRVKPDPGSGVRVGFDYLLPCWDSIDFSVDWTYFTSQGTDDTTVIRSATTFLLPIWMNRAFVPSATSAHADYKLYYNTADAQIGKNYCVGQRLSLAPHAGLRVALINQHFTTTYFGITGSGGYTSAFQVTKNNISFKAVGPRIGVDTKWDLLCGFSLLANTNFDLLWSTTRSTLRDINPDSTERSKIKDRHIQSIIPVIELFLGLGWDICGGCKNWKLNCHLGWEQQYYVNFMQFNQFINPFDGILSLTENGALGVGGLVAGINFGF